MGYEKKWTLAVEVEIELVTRCEVVSGVAVALDDCIDSLKVAGREFHPLAVAPETIATWTSGDTGNQLARRPKSILAFSAPSGKGPDSDDGTRGTKERSLEGRHDLTSLGVDRRLREMPVLHGLSLKPLTLEGKESRLTPDEAKEPEID